MVPELRLAAGDGASPGGRFGWPAALCELSAAGDDGAALCALSGGDGGMAGGAAPGETSAGDGMTTTARLQAAIAAAMREVEMAEARVMGLVRASHSATSVLWYSRDAERQRVFDAAFDEGRRMLTQD